MPITKKKQAERDAAVEKHVRMVQLLATKKWQSGGGRMLGTFEDCRQEAFVALLKAMDNFKPEKGYQFSTYAYPVIQDQLHGVAHENGLIRVPRYAQRAMLGITKIPVKDEIVAKAEAAQHVMRVAFRHEDEWHGKPLQREGDTDAVDYKDFGQAALRHLVGQQREVIWRRYFEGWTYREIAEMLQVTPQRVRGIEAEALKRLRAWYGVEEV